MQDAPPYGEHMSACVAAAKLAHAYVVCPFYELVSRNASQDTGPSYNTAVLLDRSGSTHTIMHCAGTGAMVGFGIRLTPSVRRLQGAGVTAEWPQLHACVTWVHVAAA